MLDDGTEVDDEEYFQILPPQCLLIVSEKPKLSIHTKSEQSTHFLKGIQILFGTFMFSENFVLNFQTNNRYFCLNST